MKHNRLLGSLVVCSLLLVAAVALLSTRLAGRVEAQGPAPQGDVGIQAALGTAFTYQGQLVKNGNAVSESCDFQFSLWNASSGGSQIGGPVTRASVTVQEGNFSTDLDFGAAAFQGDARYLQIGVRCPAGGGSYTTLSGRVALNPAPYALSLRPGARMSSSATSGSVFLAVSSATSGDPAGLYGEANSVSGAGVSGWNLSSSGVGVYGRTTGSSGTPYGVYGIASDNGSATSYGVYGKSNSSVGAGVGGIAPKNGVYGEASNASGTTWGVYGKSNSASGYGIYSDGNAHVEGNLTWKVVTSSISIATSAFIPELLNDSGHVEYNNEGYYLHNQSSNSEWFTAPVQLPHGATVTALEVGWHDGSDQSAIMSLRRHKLDDFSSTFDTMASVGSTGSLHTIIEAVQGDTSIDFATVDNTQYTYYLEANLPASSEDIKLHGVVIKYEFTKPY